MTTRAQEDTAALARLPNSALRATMMARLEAVETLAAALATRIRQNDGDAYAWAYGPLTGQAARASLAAGIARLDHDDEDALRLHSPAGGAAEEDDGRVTVLLPGLIASSPPTLALAAELNSAKDALDRVLRALAARPAGDADLALLPDTRLRGGSLLRVQLTAMGRLRLSHRQAVRRLQIQPLTPRAASFFWAHLPRRYRLTVAALDTRLARLQDRDPRALADRRRLAAMRLPAAFDTEVIIEEPAHVHPRCNLALPCEREGVQRICNHTHRAIMPILYPEDSTAPPLRLRRELPPYPAGAPPARKARSDTLALAPLALASCKAYLAAPRAAN